VFYERMCVVCVVMGGGFKMSFPTADNVTLIVSRQSIIATKITCSQICVDAIVVKNAKLIQAWVRSKTVSLFWA
jgi:hypothetical protein